MCDKAVCSYLVAVVAGVLLLAAVPGDVAGAVTLVTPVLLLATLQRPGLPPAGSHVAIVTSRAKCPNLLHL